MHYPGNLNGEGHKNRWSILERLNFCLGIKFDWLTTLDMCCWGLYPIQSARNDLATPLSTAPDCSKICSIERAFCVLSNTLSNVELNKWLFNQITMLHPLLIECELCWILKQLLLRKIPLCTDSQSSLLIDRKRSNYCLIFVEKIYKRYINLVLSEIGHI